MDTIKSGFFKCVVLVFFFFFNYSGVFSATRTWNGGGTNNNWANGANWGGTAPVANDDLIFDGNVRTNTFNNYPAGTVFRSITIAAGAGAFILGSTGTTNSIVLTGGAVAYVNNSSNRSQQINVPISFATNAPTFSETSNTNSSVFNGAIDNSGFTLTISNVGTTNPSTMVFNGLISGSGGLTKLGVGFINITNSNTYSGVTNISGGRINASFIADGGSNSSIGNSSSSATNLVINGGTLRYVGSTTASTNRLFTIGTGGAILYSSPTGGSGITYSNTGSVVFSGSGARTLEFGGGTAGSNDFNCAIPDPTGGSLSILKSGGSSIWEISGTNTFTGLITITSSNGTSGGTLKIGSSTAFGSIASGIVITAAGGAIDLNGFNYTAQEPLTLLGTGVTNTGALTNSSAAAATFGGLITLSGASSIIAASGDISLTNTGTITGATFGLTIGGDNNGLIAGVIATTSGTVTKQDVGIWTLSGANTFTGLTTISEGTIKVGNTSALGTVAGNTLVSSGGALDLNGTNYSSAEALTLNGTGVSGGGSLLNSNSSSATFAGLITLGSTSSIISTAGNINISNTGSISGATFGLTLGGAFNGTLGSVLATTSGTLTKQDAGTWTLSGLNSYAGLTTINGGTLKLTNASSLGSNATGTLVNSGASLDLNGVNYSTTEALTLNGTGISSGGALTNSSASASTFAGLITLGSTSSIISSAGDINVANTGTITGATFGLILGGAFNGTMSSRIETTTGTLTKQNSGTWTLFGNNSYSGITTIDAGILRLGASNVIADNSDVIITGTLDMNNFNETLGSISGFGTIDNMTGTGSPTLSTGANDIETTFSGQIKNTSGILSLTKVGIGIFRIAGNNSYSGITNINSGLLTAQNGNALGDITGGTAIASGATLVLFNFVYPNEALSMRGNGNEPKGALRTSTTLTSGTIVTFPGPITFTGNTQIGVENSNVELILTGSIIGAFSLTKISAGILTLSGSNSYSGATTVNTGILKLGSITALGTTAGGTTILDNAALNLNGINYPNAEGLSITGTGLNSSGVIFNSNTTAATYAGAITMTGNSTITVNNQITISGNINPNTLDLTKNGSSSLVFTSNTVSVRDLTLSAGTINAGASTINISRSFTSTGTFTSGTSTVNFVGSASQLIPSLGFFNVRLSNSNGASINGNITINGTITLLSGILTTGVNVVDLGANGSIVEATPNNLAPTSFVTGNVKATRNTGSTSGTVTFGGIGVDITETTKTNNSTVVLRTTGTAKQFTAGSNTYYGIERFFDIAPANDVNLNGTLVMHYFEHELYLSTEANLKLYKDSTDGWVLKKQSGVNTAANTITLGNIKDFSLWTASDYIFQPLPITLLKFVAEKNLTSDDVLLKWTTVSEIQNDYFTLEKSLDGVNWKSFAEIDGAGTTNSVHSYNYVDSNANRATTYYRLKQTDFDGKFEYSQVVVFDYNGLNLSKLDCYLYPNPSTIDNLNLVLSNKDLGIYTLEIRNIYGTLLYDSFINHIDETNVFKLSNELKEVKSGVYIMKLSKDYIPVCNQKFVLD